ncbi:MAG: TonB-dependent receptor [Alistipes sp.]|nr:TonB-dependent receptor [Alistipes sp.]
MKRFFTLLFSFMLASAASAAVEPQDTTRHIVVDDVNVIAAAPKQHFGLSKEPISSSVANLSLLEREGISSVKQLSAMMPNFYQPDYGSRMTSSIYVRGFGARIDQPVIGMTVDGVPYLNKNNYDFDMADVARVELLRGPQSTLYGRNTMGGQMNIYTLSPLLYQGLRGELEYGTGNSVRAKLNFYDRAGEKFAYSVGGYYNRTDGYFDNAFDGSNIDWGESSGGRLRTIWQMGSGWSLDNVASFGYSYEGGYAYAPYNMETEQVGEINYNSPSRYMRYNFSDGLVFSHTGEKYKFTATTSYQFMHDRMRMDNDLTPASIFTLMQEQKEHAVTEDVVLRTNDSSRRWQWITGAYGFYKSIDMGAPVNLLQDGMKSLILGNMPASMQALLTFDRDILTVDSNFKLPTYGVALYHESSLRAGERWRFTAGLRLDYEASKMKYDNLSEIGYKMGAMRPGMPEMIPNFRTVSVPFKGEEKLDYLELLPKFAVNFTTGAGDLYATVTRGYKAGGFNTQIFSDILQNKLKTALMADAMGAMGRPSTPAEPSPYDEASVTTYDPEYSWNYEVGGHLRFAEGRLGVDFAAFWIECKDQQLTVFPDGSATGRMMSNAGASRSQGAELSVAWTPNDKFMLSANYGYTHAKFEDCKDFVKNDAGERVEVDYAGNYLPYAPQHTASLMASYRIPVNCAVLDDITLNASYQGAGKIYWNEANTLEQNFYSLLNASVELRKGDYKLSLWGRNITDTDYYTFYFMSMGNSFMSQGKPCRWGATFSFAL